MSITLGDLHFYISGGILLALGFLLAFSITYTVIPSIVVVSRIKHLFDMPGKRTSHSSAIPTLGGAAVFLGLVIATIVLANHDIERELMYIFAGLLIVFFVGIKDDILKIAPIKKLISEFLAIGIIIVLGDIRITDLHGLFGVYEIPYVVSVVFSLFVYVVIINGLNLIDGIDGLASGVGIVTISSFGVWFILSHNYSYALFSFATVGSLLAFFRFNVFGGDKKIFLGDTGALVIGTLQAVFAVKFLETTLSNSYGGVYLASPAIAIGILIFPLIDTLRVFVIRLMCGRSPFTADRYHLHHKLLNLGLSHLQSTLLILAFNLLFIVLSVVFRSLGNIKLLLIILPLAIVMIFIPGVIIRYRDRKQMNQIDFLGDQSWLLPTTLSSKFMPNSDLLEGNINIIKAKTDKNAKEDLEPVLFDSD